MTRVLLVFGALIMGCAAQAADSRNGEDLARA